MDAPGDQVLDQPGQGGRVDFAGFVEGVQTGGTTPRRGVGKGMGFYSVTLTRKTSDVRTLRMADGGWSRVG